MSDTPVSVILPVFNAAQYLRQCLDSILAQTFREFELIIIDDASTDGSQAIIDAAASADDRVRSLVFDANRGVSAARNAGIEQARGDYLVFIDADDFWLEDHTLETVHAAAVREQADMVSFGFRRINEAGEYFGTRVETPAVIDLREQGGWSISYSIWTKLVSRRLLSDHAIRFENIWGEDALFCVRLYCHARRMVVLDNIFYCYRVNPSGQCLSDWSEGQLFGAVGWFAKAIERMRDSELYRWRPEVLQSIIIERIGMLYQSLGARAVDMLDDQRLHAFLQAWSACLDYFDTALEDRVVSGRNARLMRQMLDAVSAGDTAAFRHVFASDACRNEKRHAGVVTLTRQQALQMGQDMLGIDKETIRCDFGGGVIVSLSKKEAHGLAHRLINNRKPTLTLRFR